ncbi:MAG: KEOPS complex subunit Pcc1 [Caldisphaera sp.]|jgi:hypothetical protein|nr:MAG: hypothetical protein C0201_04370 [Caldisphaera sp.]
MDSNSNNIKCVATLRIESEDSNNIVKSLIPDNIKDLPPFIKIKCDDINNVILCNIEITDCNDPKRILSLKNTIDDILINIRAIIDSI